jgi:ADP-ribose pyrophosphatase YjhB (NUDIX family)
MKKIRPLALALIKNEQDQFLFHQGFDSVKDEKFYRPLGGGIEFGELGSDALEREFHEEINEQISVEGLIDIYENIFTFEGREGHEIILLYRAHFVNTECYSKSFDIIEGNRVVGKAVWKTLDEIKRENAKVYPLGIEEFLSSQSPV